MIRIIYDIHSGEIFFRGTMEECKEWWWDQLFTQNHICGYATKEVKESQLCRKCGTLLEEEEEGICNNCQIQETLKEGEELVEEVSDE